MTTSPPLCFTEEAVNEVKRQAMSELQKAVSDAERKAHELITTERAKMERALAEAKRQASEDALTVINQQEDSSEVGPLATSTLHCCLQVHCIPRVDQTWVRTPHLCNLSANELSALGVTTVTGGISNHSVCSLLVSKYRDP